jgi:oligopeptide transport system substrate-binding protein
MKVPAMLCDNRWRRLRLPLVGLAAIGAAVGGCQSSSVSPSATPARLAANQLLIVPIEADLRTLDPVDSGAYGARDLITRNVFGGLYRFDDQLRVVPYVAAAMPDVSADGTIYTFHLRPEARFSNGDPVTAVDVKYSWDRATVAGVDDFTAVAGNDAVQAGTATSLSGVVVVDAQTLTVRLTHADGTWLGNLAGSPDTYLVDQKAIQTFGPDWSLIPDGLVGTGPFRMTARTPGHSMEFAPVQNWWGGSTGHLTSVRVVIASDEQSLEQDYQHGTIDMFDGGYDMRDIPDVERSLRAAGHSAEIHDIASSELFYLENSFDMTYLCFSLGAGPFAGQGGRLGREAFSLAIDRAALVKDGQIDQARAATGGTVPAGDIGYLGDNMDPSASFDPVKARADLQQWDPAGSKRNGLVYAYIASKSNDAAAKDLQKQWKDNLAVDVSIHSLDPSKIADVGNGGYPLFREAWSAGSPEEFYDGMFISPPVIQQVSEASPNLVAAISQADSESFAGEAANYRAAAAIVNHDVDVAPLFYTGSFYALKPYVQRSGGNSDFPPLWSELSILRH